MDKPIRIALCIPCYSYIPANFLSTVVQSIIENVQKKFVLDVIIQLDFPLDKARNNLVESALSKNVDYLWFVDTDNLVPVGCLEKMIADMDKERADIVTAIYFEKSKPYYPVIRHWTIDGFWKIEDAPLGQIIEIDGCGMGCCLIRADLFRKINPPWFAFSWEFWHEKPIQLSEDLFFCRKAKKVGAKMICDSSLISSHLGAGIDAWEYMSFTDIRQRLHADREEYVEDVMEFTKQTREEVLIKLYKGNIILAQEWNEKNPQTDEEVKKFYKETQNYLYDSGSWHFGDRRQYDIELVTAVRENIKPKRILDFGAGISQNAYMLAQEGLDVTVADLDSYSLNFAEFRFKQHNVPAKFWRVDTEPKPTEKFDLILCFEVLEHLPKEELNKTIDLLKSLKAENGKILLSYNFGKTDVYPMHFDADVESLEKIKSLLK